jgi:hypothetical protein
VHAHPLSLYLPSRKKLQFYAQLSPYFVSIPMYYVILSVDTGKNMFEYGFLIRKSYERLKLHNNFRSEVIYVHNYYIGTVLKVTARNDF